MSVSYGELILDEADSGGNLIVRGSVTVALSQRVPDAGDDLIFGQAPVTGVFRVGGPPSVMLPFNDTFGPQGDDAPGTTYTITYNGVPGSPASWSFYFLSTNGDTQRLSALASTPAAQPGQMYVALPDTPPADDTYVLGLSSASPLVTEWVEQSGGGGGGSGTVTSVSVATANGFAGTVANPSTTPAITVKTTVTGILKSNGTAVSAATAGTDYLAPDGSGADLTGITAAQVGADASGAAAAAQAAAAAASDPSGSAATALTAAEAYADTNKLDKSANLSDVASASTARTNLGLGSAATHASTDFDVSGAAATAQSNAESFATSAVGTETSRAEAAETLLAPLASPALTGNPTAPTQSAGNDSTRLATTAYADAAVAVETTRAETAEALKLAKASNLSDVASASTAYGNISPMTTLGDIEYENSTPAAARLAGNTTSTKKFLTQTGTGSVSAAPGWNTIATGDVPTLNQNTTGNAATATAAAGLESATTTVAVSSATAPSSGEVLTATSSTAATWQPASGGTSYASALAPASLGLAIASFASPFANSTNAMPNEQSYAVLATAQATTTINHLGIAINSAGATPGSGVNVLAIFSAAGTLLGNTADMTTAFESTGWIEGTLTSGVAITAGTNYYLWAVSSFTGSTPAFSGPSSSMNSTKPLNGSYLGGWAVGASTVPGSFTPSGLGNQSVLPAMYGR